MIHRRRQFQPGGGVRRRDDQWNVSATGGGGDDRIGGVQELRLTLTDVERARRGTEPQVIKTLRHVSGDADYTTVFVLQTTLFVIN